jgi:hypothetical protein
MIFEVGKLPKPAYEFLQSLQCKTSCEIQGWLSTDEIQHSIPSCCPQLLNLCKELRKGSMGRGWRSAMVLVTQAHKNKATGGLNEWLLSEG